MSGYADYAEEPIAIIGSGCRFPGGSSTPSKLWDLLKAPRDVASKIDRFSAEAFYHKDGSHHGTSNVLHSYLLEEDTRQFDAQFFSIPGSEADGIDPQQRLLMEVVYEALESSGHQIEELSGSSTAVYVGVMCNDFAHITYHDLESLPKYAATGTASSILSNRVSYFFNWTGPSMTIDTACSSSLIATHQAVQSLRKGESNLAVAAGANLIFGPTNFVAESNVQMLSPTGRSRMWDSGADGYARGEGVAAVMLKRLSDAIRDGDTIECIVRETGTNQDGRTTGITMPSSVSQAELIRNTYSRAGLSPLTDRCQYFEAHGTGTKAGDPQEAGAIYKAFFGEKKQESENPDDVLYVGSIKTIIGHTEGTAGVAGLLKASLSVQNGVIPPNMLFEELNPDIKPYYGKLQILTDAKPWPKLPAGVPRRASVNSFGFGGANAHAIIESFEPSLAKQYLEKKALVRHSTAAIPFVFSANSEKTLGTQIERYLEFLENADESDINLRDLAWTLSRRSAFSLRTYCSALTIDTLRAKLTAKLEAKKSDNKALGVRPAHKTKSILGVFTGQGAQWPRMGYKLIESSPFAASRLQVLEDSLNSLPEGDRPEWSLKEELAKAADVSRVMEGTFSQPLCTAVQVVLVDMLARVGVSFDVVVGHSSGEIAAAYAAGFLTASDAVRIAYYRGLYGKLAGGDNIGEGSMLAVGTSMEDANELCELPTMARHGRFNVAASNSPASVTLSGDKTAIDRAKFIFEDEKKFVRALKVDTAYHSHHMEPCAEPYMDAMARIGTKAQPGNGNCRWFSSVLGGEEVSDEMAGVLKDSYWRDNLLQPVLFSQALQKALETAGTPALALEVGAHAALKGPASQVLEEVTGTEVPYSGVLARGSNDIEAFSEGVGAIWANIGTSAVNISETDALFAVAESDKPELLRTIPGYVWDHSQTFWAESRLSKAMRFRQSSQHELLGVRLEAGENVFRWRNFIKPGELPWLRGHQIQGQLIFPGAGFASMAIEASRILANESDDEVSQIELQDLTIQRAVGFMDETIGVESLVSLSNFRRDDTARLITCDFVCETCPTKDAAPITTSTAKVTLRLGYGSDDTLPPRDPEQDKKKMTDIDREIFYNSLGKLGYNYSEMFEGITSLRRSTERASGTIHIDAAEGYKTDLAVHPAPLDVAFQGMFGAIGAPGDGQLWTLMVPTVIRSIRINPYLSEKTSCLRTDLPFDASVTIDPASHEVAGDIDVFDESGNALLLIEGLHVTPVTQVTAKADTQKMTETVWALDKPNAARDFTEFWKAGPNWTEDAEFFERACFYYMKKLHESITAEERDEVAWHPKKYLAWVASVIEQVAAGTHATIKKEWLNDTAELETAIAKFAKKNNGFRHLKTLGNNLLPFVRGEVAPLEPKLLDQVYKNSFGTTEFNGYVAGLVGQLAHKLRNMEILEIGAGNGYVTEAILNTVGDSYGSYTYTDITADTFDYASEVFKEESEKFIYQIFDVEQEAPAQGIIEGGYDLVIASKGLHATAELEKTLVNVRKLLKPGGQLILLEFTDTSAVAPSYLFGTLAEWWVGEVDGREHHPLVSQQSWDALMRKSGFSGIDTATPETKWYGVPLSIMMTQAVDVQMKLIRQPLEAEADLIRLPKLLVVSGESEFSAKVQADTLAALGPYAGEVQIVDRFDKLQESDFGPKQLVLCFTELDESVFHPFTEAKWLAIQLLTERALNVLWLTHGAGIYNAFSNMMVGVGRCMVHEKPDLRLQFIDYADRSKVDSKYVAETLLRMHVASTWRSFATPYVPSWVLEREIRVIDGRPTIPRCIPCIRLDHRYNSSRRTIRNEVPLEETVVAVDTQAGVSELREIKTPAWAVTSKEGNVEIKVHRSSLAALSVPSVGSVYLVVGRLTSGNGKVLALSQTQQSVVFVPKSWSVQVDVPDEQDTSLLVAAANVVLGEFLLSSTPKGTSLLAHEPSAVIAAALKDLAASRNVNVSFTTSSKDHDEGVQYIHPSAQRRTIQSIIPRTLSSFVYFSDAEDSARIGSRIEAQLPASVRRLSPASAFSDKAVVEPKPSTEVASGLLQQARIFYETHAAKLDTTERVQELVLDLVPGYQRNPEDSTFAVANWTSQKAASVKLSPPENIVQFRSDKTYWLAGLTGELGLSLARWMVQRGARYIVMTSRKPKLDQEFLSSMKAAGANITALSMDITSAESVLETYAEINRNLPPIVGVCNGAMVLNDQLLASQPYEDFNATIRPKVEGTRLLDALFQQPTLDFFIVFSSLAWLTGNIGQSSYASANGYMAGTMEARRRRGLAGSVMNLAGIYGIGYITRREATLMDRLEKMGYSNISEWDYLQFFAEAVLAGNADAPADTCWDISSAVKPGDPDAENPPPWLEVPRFSYFRKVKARTAGGEDGGAVSVRSQLKDQTTMEGVKTVLLAGLIATLYKLLGMRPEDNSISPSMSLIELGIDSLMAVDMRLWFTRELDLDLPVLKLLGGASVEDMIEDTAARISPELIPNVQDAAGGKSDEESSNQEETESNASGENTPDSVLSDSELGVDSLVTTQPQSSAVSDSGKN
ncbi:putative polyketide synthase [Jackrogersella minutella]|nr:putative polyketide synthase [Jackrogersella minutella]